MLPNSKYQRGAGAGPESFETLIPARLDRLPWHRFHWLLILSLGITWVLDGLEVTLLGAIAGALESPDTLGLSAAQIGFISSSYLAGAVLGAVVFGFLTDHFGRRRFYFLTLSIYLLGVGLTALSWDLWSFACFRFLTGAGIGGEYSAINSAIDELMPARLRGRVALFLNGSFWLGAALGSVLTLIVLNPLIFPRWLGWRVGFAIGPAIGLVILYLRRFIPESPRWQMTHGQAAEAERTVAILEEQAFDGNPPPLPAGKPLRLRIGGNTGFRDVLRTIAVDYRASAFLSVGLVSAQAFTYNAIFFTYALVLIRYFGVKTESAGFYLLPFAISNFCGPLVLGRFFDTVGRRQLIAGTFGVAGTILLITGFLFVRGKLNLFDQLGLWTALFFFASAAASSAYLTVGELFPLELRAAAIAIFYAMGTAVGGVVGPWFFGYLIDSGSPLMLCEGYTLAGLLMLGAAMLELFLGVDASQKSLEELAAPLSSRL